MSAVSGACHCGAVRFHVPTGVRRVVNCHCGLCRRINGSAFSSYAVVPLDALVVEGQSNVSAYAVTARATKHFCGRCGSPLYNLNNKYPGACMLYLGAVDGSDRHVPSVNVYCGSMLAWLTDIASMQRFEEGIERGAKTRS